MSQRLFVGNLSWNATEDTVREAFAAIGEVASVEIKTDRESGRSRGFGFVEMANDDDAQKAISELNGKEIDGRPVTVNVARPMRDQ